MSFGWVAAAFVTTTAWQIDQQRKLSNQANDQAKAAAKASAAAADEANNKANAKSPNTSALMAANMLAAKGGQSGTMLTGPQGVDPGSLMLGKTSLLGKNPLLGGG